MEPWTTTPVTDSLVRGALELEPTEAGVLPHRLPATARAQVPDEQLAMAEAQPSGVRLVFRTAATAVELDVVSTKVAYRGAPPRPDGVFDLRVDGSLAAQASTTRGRLLTIDMTTGTRELSPGEVDTVRFDDLAPEVKSVEIWLPHTEATELVALRTNAPVEPAGPTHLPVWVHHGSSISHGSNAASPSTTWPALAAAAAGVELVNLGFGGSALLDPFTARTIRDTPADLISVKLGINLVNADLMRTRAFAPAVHGFLDTIREGHPHTPLLVVSSILCPIHEETPGPAALDPEAMKEGRASFMATGDASDPTRLTLTTIRAELARIVASRAIDDPHLTYLDGRVLYGADDAADLPLPDALHPDAQTHQLIGQRFAATVFGADGAFSGFGRNRPEIVCICGSTRFVDEMRRANRDLTFAGVIVVAPGVLSRTEAHDADEPITTAQKSALDALHLRKIDLADRVLVVNPGGYVGESTSREIAYAHATGKPISFTDPV